MTVGRRKGTPEARAFWSAVERDAAVVRTLPGWARAGVAEEYEPIWSEDREVSQEEINADALAAMGITP